MTAFDPEDWINPDAKIDWETHAPSKLEAAPDGELVSVAPHETRRQ